MLKKALAAVGVAGLLVLGGSAAAMAADYPPSIACTATPATVTVGSTSTIECTGLAPGSVTLTVTGPGVVDGDLASIVFAADPGTATVTKTVTPDGTVSATLMTHATGDFVVTASDSTENSGSVTVTATAATTGGGGGGGGELPPTGGAIPTTAIWLGVGVIGIGGIAVVAAAARRRARADR